MDRKISTGTIQGPYSDNNSFSVTAPSLANQKWLTALVILIYKHNAGGVGAQDVSSWTYDGSGTGCLKDVWGGGSYLGWGHFLSKRGVLCDGSSHTIAITLSGSSDWKSMYWYVGWTKTSGLKDSDSYAGSFGWERYSYLDNPKFNFDAWSAYITTEYSRSNCGHATVHQSGPYDLASASNVDGGSYSTCYYYWQNGGTYRDGSLVGASYDYEPFAGGRRATLVGYGNLIRDIKRGLLSGPEIRQKHREILAGVHMVEPERFGLPAKVRTLAHGRVENRLLQAGAVPVG